MSRAKSSDKELAGRGKTKKKLSKKTLDVVVNFYYNCCKFYKEEQMINFLEVTKSRLRQKLLCYFFTNPGANLYLREIASVLKEDPGNLSKELTKLEKEKIFISIARGNQKYFTLNKRYSLYRELKSIIFKTIGVEGSLRQIMESTDGILLSFIYGSFAQNKENSASDIDLLIAGSPDEDKLMQRIEDLEKRLQREINYNIYPEEEYKERIKKKDSFILNILKEPKIILKGNINGI